MQLTSLVSTSDVSCMWFTDEKLFVVATPKNSQNDRLYVPAATKKKDRRDMIETYKILSGKYDTNVVPNLKTTGIQATRGNDLGIFKTRFKYDLRKFYFTNSIVYAWNSLPNWIVMANSTNTFKRRLDTHWQDQEIIYDFHAQLQGTGSRSDVFS